MGQWEVVRDILEALTQEDDEIVEVWYLLALALHASNQLDDSKAALECAVKLARREEHQSADITEAIIELQTALGVDPNGGEMHGDEDAREDGNPEESPAGDMDI